MVANKKLKSACVNGEKRTLLAHLKESVSSLLKGLTGHTAGLSTPGFGQGLG